MPAEYTYQMYMGFGLHPHLTPDPPLRKWIFFERGGMGFGARLRTFCRFAVAPPGPSPGPPRDRPRPRRSSNEQGDRQPGTRPAPRPSQKEREPHPGPNPRPSHPVV